MIFCFVQKIAMHFKTPPLRFCTFMVSNFTSFEDNKGVLLLKRMADGVDPVPDLLVTGE